MNEDESKTALNPQAPESVNGQRVGIRTHDGHPQDGSGKIRSGKGSGATGDDDSGPVPDHVGATVHVTAATLVARYAAENRRLEALTHELERILGTNPTLTGALGSGERKALQKLDYLRQALGDLARSLESFVPAGDVDPASVTHGLTLEEVAWRLRHGKPPAVNDSVDFFD